MAAKFRNALEEAGAFILAEGPRWMIIFLICFAPFCYGLRDGAGEDFFAAVSFFAFFIFAWKCFLDGEWPRIPAWLLFCVTWILLQGFWMTLNANSHYRFHDDLITVRFLELAPFPELPGSRTRFKSPEHFYSLVGVLCLMIVVVNAPPRVRESYFRVMAGTSICFSAFAVAMKFWGVDGLSYLWNLENDRAYRTVFGTFRYHGNAGTYLAIGLALTSASLISAELDFQKRRPVFFTIGFPLLLLAAALNTSRAGWALAIYVAGSSVIGFIGLTAGRRHQSRSHHRRMISFFVAASLLLTAAFIAFWADRGYKLHKMEKAIENLGSRYPRELFLTMANETPALGFGPGAFPMVFPKYQLMYPGHFPSDWWWNEAHQDYFQFFFDWGPVGVWPWMAIFLLPIATAIRRPTEAHPVAEPFQFMGIAALSAVLIHSVFDFPLQVTSLLLYFCLIAACLTLPANGTTAGIKAG